MDRIPFDEWVLTVTQRQLQDVPVRLHNYLRNAYAEGVSIRDAHAVHVAQRRTTECPHLSTKRGDDLPRRWGSYQSEVCLFCGSFRALTHHGAPTSSGWQPSTEYAAQTAETEDE